MQIVSAANSARCRLGGQRSLLHNAARRYAIDLRWHRDGEVSASGSDSSIANKRILSIRIKMETDRVCLAHLTQHFPFCTFAIHESWECWHWFPSTSKQIWLGKNPERANWINVCTKCTKKALHYEATLNSIEWKIDFSTILMQVLFIALDLSMKTKYLCHRLRSIKFSVYNSFTSRKHKLPFADTNSVK